MSEPYGLPAGSAINYRALGFPAWVDELCRQWGLDSSTYPGHQEGDRPDIGCAPNPNHENRGIDWAGPADRMLAFARWLVSIAPERRPGAYGPPGLEMVIYRDIPTGTDITYPPWVDFSGDLPGHTDHVHTRQSASLIDYAAPQPTALTVPLVEAGGGRWTSSSSAWAHLIMRESGGDPYIIQQIVDVNSGGNEAEGLFQITPATWRAHNGTEFAPTARLASPQQQAIVAARIFTRNPSGSDWGAGLPGREDAAELAAGLVPITPTPTSEEDFLSALNPDEQRELLDRTRQLWGALFNENPSKSRYADARGWATKDYVRNIDGHLFDLIVEHNAALGDEWSLSQIRVAAAKGDKIAAKFLDRLTTAQTTTPAQPTPAVTPPAPQPPTPQPQPTVQYVPVPYSTPKSTNGEAKTTGQVIGELYQALDALRLADALPIEARAPLQALIQVLQVKNGSNI